MANRFEVIRKISSGSFGDVFLGKDNKKNKFVAIKIEKHVSFILKGNHQKF